MPLKGYKAHKTLHQDAGTDELSVTGLSGLLADDQHVLDAEVTAVAIAKALLTEQGDIIYASAASTPAALPHGTSSQYLKSGGDAANPSWDTPAGGGATKEFFAHADYTAAKVVLQNYLLPSAADSVTAYIDFYVPNDFTSIVSAVVVVLYDNTEAAANIDLYSDYAAKDETYNTHAESSTVPTYAITANKWTEISIAGILSSLAAGDYVGIKIIAAITHLKRVYVLGVRFRYS